LQTRDVAGKTIGEAGLRGMPGIHVLAYDPKANPALRSSPPDLQATLEVGDVLWIASDVAGFTFLNKYPGIQVSQQAQVDRTGKHDARLTNRLTCVDSAPTGYTQSYRV
jgi:hypothetical protein